MVPKITFALFTYNQERYVAEAVRAALSQTYENLEVVISDDASTDSTWAAIQAEVAEYAGPHRLLLNRNSRNLGVIAHINRVADLATSEILVMAAGDDISMPERVSRCYAYFESERNLHAVFSDVKKIGPDGGLIRSGRHSWLPGSEVTLSALIDGGGGVGIGAAYAYRKSCISWPWKVSGSLVSEDRILPLRAHLLGGVAHIPEPLVAYRVTGENLSHRLISSGSRAGSRPDHIEELRRTLRYAMEQGLIGPRAHEASSRALDRLPIMNRLEGRTQAWPSLPRKGLLWISRRLMQCFSNLSSVATLPRNPLRRNK